MKKKPSFLDNIGLREIVISELDLKICTDEGRNEKGEIECPCCQKVLRIGVRAIRMREHTINAAVYWCSINCMNEYDAWRMSDAPAEI